MRFFSLTTTTSGSAFGNWPIIKQIAWVLGLLMQGIFIVLSGMGIRHRGCLHHCVYRNHQDVDASSDD